MSTLIKNRVDLNVMKTLTTSQAVKVLRQRLQKSQQAFATRLDLSISTIATYEAGRNPTGRSLVALADLARVSNHNDLAGVFWLAFLKESELDRYGPHVMRFYERRGIDDSCEDFDEMSSLVWVSRDSQDGKRSREIAFDVGRALKRVFNLSENDRIAALEKLHQFVSGDLRSFVEEKEREAERLKDQKDAQ